MINQVLSLAAQLPSGLPDPKAADKLLKERDEFRQAMASGDQVGALTELADRVYYACKEIHAAASESGLTVEQAFAVCTAKYELRARLGNPKNDAEEREAVAAVVKPQETEFAWNNGMRNRSRTPRLFAKLPEGKWQQFFGQTIPGVLGVVSASHTKNGKWSNTDYVLKVKSAIVVQLLQPFEYFGNSWSDHASAVTVLAGEYEPERAARELMPVIESRSYREAVERANESERVLLR